MKERSLKILVSMYDLVKDLPNQKLGELFRAICEYGFDGNVQIESADVGFAFNCIKPRLDKDREVSLKRSESGKKGCGNPNFAKGKRNPYYQIEDKQKDNFDNSEINKDKQSYDFVNIEINKDIEKDKQKDNFVNVEINKTDDLFIEEESTADNNKYISTEKEDIDSKDSKKGKEEKKKTREEVRQETDRRKMVFYNSLIPFLDRYPKEMVREFFDYWSEMNKSQSKMRFEQEKTWETSKRLATWDRNNKSRRYGVNKFERATEAEQQLISSVAESSVRKLEQERNGESGFIPLPI